MEVDDPVFSDEDLGSVDQVDREVVAVAMAVEEARALGDPVQDHEAESDGSDSGYEDEEDDHDEHVTEVQPHTKEERMALESFYYEPLF